MCNFGENNDREMMIISDYQWCDKTMTTPKPNVTDQNTQESVWKKGRGSK